MGARPSGILASPRALELKECADAKSGGRRYRMDLSGRLFRRLRADLDHALKNQKGQVR
jgi:hypothetical protein